MSAAAIPPLAPERPVVWPRRYRETLANGLRVVLVESHTIPKLTLQLLVRSGNAAAARVSPGLAEMTATVVRTGTRARSLLAIEEQLRRMGADLSTGAGTDSSTITLSGLADSALGLLELARDLASHASFPEEEFERERRQRLESLRIERATPDFLAGERLRRVLFGDHPYGRVIPTEADVEGYRWDDLVSYYRQHYVPDNAVLLLAGDFQAERVLADVERVFGDWPAGGVEALLWREPPPLRGRVVHLVHLGGTVQAEILVGNRAITRRHPDWPPLSVANAIYGGAFNSRLVTNIREQKGYTYSPGSDVVGLRADGYVSVHAAVRNEVAAATLTELFYEMDRMRALPVGEEELDDARSYLAGVFSLGLATHGGLIGQLTTLYLNDLPEDHLEGYRERIRGVAAGDVLAAARRHLDSVNAQIVVVGDRAVIEEQAALFGPVTTYDAQGHVL